MRITIEKYINIHHGSCTDLTNVDANITNTLSWCHDHLCLEIKSLRKHLCSYCMEWLRNYIEAIELKNFIRPLDGIERSESCVIKINSFAWNTFFHECLLHVLWLVIVCIRVISTYEYTINFS